MNSEDADFVRTYDFDYTGSEQEFTVPCNGTYKLETWGASGGTSSTSGDYNYATKTI